MTLLDRLARAVDAPASDGMLAGDDVGEVATHATSATQATRATPAAVLVAVVRRPEPGLLLTVRTDTLRHHAGQVAFPGGRVEDGEGVAAAALREAWEEVALRPADVAILGLGDVYRTVTGFAVTPVIAAIPADLPLVAQASEVADIFEVPLAHVVDPANQKLRHVDWNGASRAYYEIAWGERRIWGATAAMIVNLSRRLGQVR